MCLEQLWRGGRPHAQEVNFQPRSSRMLHKRLARCRMPNADFYTLQTFLTIVMKILKDGDHAFLSFGLKVSLPSIL
jgi:hypothetical protein